MQVEWLCGAGLLVPQILRLEGKYNDHVSARRCARLLEISSAVPMVNRSVLAKQLSRS